MCRLAGCTYRQLDYWTRQGVLTPSTVRGGSERCWSERELVAVAACARLAALGATCPVMRRLVEAVMFLDLTSLPSVAAVDAGGQVRFGPGLALEDVVGSWLVLVDHPGRR